MEQVSTLGPPVEPPEDVWAHAVVSALDHPHDVDDLADLVPIGDWAAADGSAEVPDGVHDSAEHDDPDEQDEDGTVEDAYWDAGDVDPAVAPGEYHPPADRPDPDDTDLSS